MTDKKQVSYVTAVEMTDGKDKITGAAKKVPTGTELTAKELKRIVGDAEAINRAVAREWLKEVDTSGGAKRLTAVEGQAVEATGPAMIDVIKAFGEIDMNDENAVTKDGKPEVALLSDFLGKKVTAAQRDEAFAIFEAVIKQLEALPAAVPEPETVNETVETKKAAKSDPAPKADAKAPKK